MEREHDLFLILLRPVLNAKQSARGVIWKLARTNYAELTTVQSIISSIALKEQKERKN